MSMIFTQRLAILLSLPLLFLNVQAQSKVAVEKMKGVQIQESEDKLEITVNGKFFSEYRHKDLSRPILFPIIGPSGKAMTRNWPMKETPNEEQDHPHHKSLWWAHGAMNGVDFWSESKTAGKTAHQKFTKIESGDDVGVIKSQNQYVAADGKVIATDERTIRVYTPKVSSQAMDFEITIHASHGPLTFGDTKEGTMAVRLAETMRLKGKVGKGHIVNSEGVRDGQTWGKRAKWVDYHGPVEDKTVGLAIFDHPTNPRFPTWWHVRDYGLFAANPFGLHDFEKKPAGAGELKVEEGKSITFKYRFYFHDGDEQQGRVEEQWGEYAKQK
ncbi:MAG: PmoA family protein [Verrucomicrobiales bacterium]